MKKLNFKNMFNKATKMVSEAQTIERLKKILKGIELSAKITAEEKGTLVSQIETRRNYIGFDLFDDYLKP